MSIEFKPWPKTPRLRRDIVITEKIDGCNVAVHVEKLSEGEEYPADAHTLVVDGERYVVAAQSRNRLITPGKTSDHYGFAAWVYKNAAELVKYLGAGTHFGEWWGQGIQRGYGRKRKCFSLFNADRHGPMGLVDIGGVDVESVPVLYEGPFDMAQIKYQLDELRSLGSLAAPFFQPAEGICIYHRASKQVFKVTLENDDAGKGQK